MSDIPHLISVTDMTSGKEALYLNDELVFEDHNIHCHAVAEYAGDKPIRFSHVIVELPKGTDFYPPTFGKCVPHLRNNKFWEEQA